MDFTFYGDDSKGIVKLDPRTKLLIFLTSGILAINAYRIAPIMIFGAVLCLVLALCGKWITALKCMALLSLACYTRYMVETSGRGASAVLIIVSSLLSIFLFTFPVLISFLLLAQTTRISHFLSALQAMHLPAALVIPIAVIFRFVPTVQEEWTGIRKAMAFRGIELNMMNAIRHPMKTVEYVLIPLLFSTISVMEELAAAALARGMDAGVKRSSYEVVKLRAADYIVIAVFLCLIWYIFRYGKAGIVS